MKKYRQKLISLAAAAAILVSAIPVHVAAFENHDTEHVNSLPNRTPYYTLEENDASNWSASREDVSINLSNMMIILALIGILLIIPLILTI